ncbi:MAG TPA: hypothetical protein DEA59_10185 [Microbacterium sp.]|nr:hypothetical protein [Microbacterium sp.]HBR89620.1 hypothetical protein [Microbacterium sp.]|tara:strand:+ start:4245 stop:4559 length:315 start_codon:yes stop_codon:yes gene_type:complete
MGSNRRYSIQLDRLADDRILETIAAKGALQSLTASEIGLGRVPLTIDPQPTRRVKAWVRFGDTPVKVDAVAVRWTSRAVGIEFDVKGVRHRCWVWEGAVDSVDG